MGNTHTLNIPIASNMNDGLLSSSDYNTFNNKMSSLNGMTSPNQNLSVSTMGPFGWSSMGNTHTLNIPIASNMNDGLLSSSDYNAFSNKMSSALMTGRIWVGGVGNNATDVTMSGDATLSYMGALTISDQAVSFNKIQNINTGKLLGRSSGGWGSTEELSIGTGLILSGGTLSATNGGTVTSVGLSLPAEFSVSNSPVTNSGTLTGSWTSQVANKVFASPDGSSGSPSFRSLKANDIPNLDAGKITTGILPIANGGTGASTLGGLGTVPRMGATMLIPSNILDDGSNVSINSSLKITPTTALGAGLLPYGVAAGNTSELRFNELVSNGSNYVGFKAPDNITANKVWTLPSADGSAQQILSTDGAGNLAWTNISAKPCLTGMFAPVNNSGYCVDNNTLTANTLWEASNTCSAAGKRLCTLSEWYNAVRNYNSSVNYTYGSQPYEWLDYGGSNSGTVIKMDSGGGTPPTTSTDDFTNNHEFRCCYSR